MWLQIGEEEGAPLVYFHQVNHMWVGYADCQSGTLEEGAEAEERQARAHVLTKQAVLWRQMQQDAQLAACVESTSRRVEVWGQLGRCWHWRCMSGKQYAEAQERPGTGTRTQKCIRSGTLWPWWTTGRQG